MCKKTGVRKATMEAIMRIFLFGRSLLLLISCVQEEVLLRAIAEYDQAIKLNPQSTAAFNKRGSLEKAVKKEKKNGPTTRA